MNKIAKFQSLFYIVVLLFTIQSCQKSDDDAVNGGESTVKISLSVGEPDEENITIGSTKTTTRTSESKVQISSVAISDNITMDVTVIRDDEPSNLYVRTSSQGSAKAATSTVTKTLDKDIKYRVAVYNNDGSHLSNHDYAYGNEASTPGIKLDAGKTYTFIVYSVNSKTDLPNISNQGSLNNAILSNISADLMYFKKTMTLTHGNNDLSAVLKHQFSQITTTIQMDNSMTGSIGAISGTQITPTKAGATLKFSNNSLTFPNDTQNSNISFETIPADARAITSNAAMLISPNTTSAAFKIGSITLDSETKTNISVPDIKINPGRKYNLILNFRTCTKDVTSDAMNWKYEEQSWYEWLTKYTGIYKTDEGKYYKNNEVIKNTFSAPKADYGFQFDITELDNAFNMQVNNQFILGTSTNDQIQFQTNTRLNTVRNIQFIDGTEYSLNGIPEVYNMKGSSTKPLIRILISRNGEVTMLGSKSSEGVLVPLRLKNNAKFNKVLWNGEGNNTVVVSQKVDGKTVVIGKGTGRDRIACPK